MNRKVFAIIEIDDEIAHGLDNNYVPDKYLEREFGWLEQSGISLKKQHVFDVKDNTAWRRYINYLIEWAFAHSEDAYQGASPRRFDKGVW